MPDQMLLDIPLFTDEEPPNYLGADALERKVRSRDAESSWSAARISESDQMAVKDFILLILARRGPMTDDAIFDSYQAAGGHRLQQRVRTARGELRYPKRGPALVELADKLGVSRAGAEGTQRWQLAAGVSL